MRRKAGRAGSGSRQRRGPGSRGGAEGGWAGSLLWETRGVGAPRRGCMTLGGVESAGPVPCAVAPSWSVEAHVGSHLGPEALRDRQHESGLECGRVGLSPTPTGVRGNVEAPTPPPSCPPLDSQVRVHTGWGAVYSSIPGWFQAMEPGGKGPERPEGPLKRCGAAREAGGGWGQEATGQGLALQTGREPRASPRAGQTGPPAPRSPRRSWGPRGGMFTFGPARFPAC